MNRDNTKLFRIGLGGAALAGDHGGYSLGSTNLDDPVTLVKRAYELGINLFDTAPIYGFGHSEKILGLALQGLNPRSCGSKLKALTAEPPMPKRYHFLMALVVLQIEIMNFIN